MKIFSVLNLEKDCIHILYKLSNSVYVLSVDSNNTVTKHIIVNNFTEENCPHIKTADDWR